MVGHGADVVVLIVTGGDRLTIEKIEIHEICPLRADLDGGGDELFGRQDEVRIG